MSVAVVSLVLPWGSAQATVVIPMVTVGNPYNDADTTRNDMGALRALAETGCFMEYDTFGSEDTSHPPLSHQDGVSDVQRMERIELLIEHGRWQLSHYKKVSTRAPNLSPPEMPTPA